MRKYMKLNSKGLGAVVIIIIIAVIGVLGVAGFAVYKANSDKPQTTTVQQAEKPVEEEKVAAPAPTGTVITTGDSEFGPMLFDDKGQAIYIWELEESATAECYSNCAEAWPPVLTNGTPQASGSVNNELLGTTTRTDGTTQVTYNGHPLYYYAHEKPGEVKCHNISTHGGLWWVIQPNGNRAA